jgi:hypothetical protein
MLLRGAPGRPFLFPGGNLGPSVHGTESRRPTRLPFGQALESPGPVVNDEVYRKFAVLALGGFL